MTNPTRQDIINAHDSLEELKNAALKTADFCGDVDHFLMCKDEILKLLPPRPKPTMDEIEWSEEYFLAEAEHSACGSVIMLSEGIMHGDIRIMRSGEKDGRVHEASAKDLTPTGRRFILTDARQ